MYLLNWFSYLLSTTILVVGLGGVTVQAETMNSAKDDDIALSASSNVAFVGEIALAQFTSEPTILMVAEDLQLEPVSQQHGAIAQGSTSPGTETPDTAAPEQPASDGIAPPPTPETAPLETVPSRPSSTPTLPDPLDDPTTPGTTSPTDTTTPETTPADIPDDDTDSDGTPPGTFTPDTSDVSPGRATRSGPSYLGVGGNIGIGDGDTALGEGSFAAFSKVGLTSNVSARPSVMFSDDPTILLPLTLDFNTGAFEATEELSEEFELRIAPYIGIGIAISTGDEGAVDFLATGGVDVPLSGRFTGTAAVNASLFDNPAVGLLVGVGYNF